MLTNGEEDSSSVQRSFSLKTLDEIDLNVFTVQIRKLSFSYDRTFFTKKNVLQNIDMSFPKSAIYGLLGPSGCGKTTLLKLILGLKKPKSGTIEVNGRKPNDPINQIPGCGVGFQPQEAALYEEFTIRETLNYFCEIYGMNWDFKEKRTKELIEFLELPDPDRRIRNLSGGQQRRVSLAVAIVHNPPFLILDEPTVGVDPLLREKIWDHLIRLSNREKTSILITTHYVEEARRAHVIALMRSGELLVEQTPKVLFAHFNVNTLEKVFLRVCMAQEKTGQQIEMPKSFIETIQKRKSKMRTSSGISATHLKERFTLYPSFLKKCWALIKKNYIRITREILMLCFQILSPALSMFLFMLCIGESPQHLKVCVFNGEKYEKPLKNECNFTDMAEQYMKIINKLHIDLIAVKTLNDLNQSISDGFTYGGLIFEPQFTHYLCRRVRLTNITEIMQSNIVYKGDLTDITIHNTIYKELNEALSIFIERVGQALATHEINNIQTNETIRVHPDVLKPLLHIDKPVYGSPDSTFRDFMTPGMIISVVFILAVGLTALSFVTEKKQGVMERTLMTGVKIYEILFAQIFIQIFVLLIQISLLLFILFTIFETTHKGYSFFMFLIILMQGVLGMTYGLVISIIAPDEQSALIIAFGSFFPFLLLSGVFWPIEGIHYLFKEVSYFMPQTTAILSLRNLMLKGWGIEKFHVWLGFATTLTWTVNFFILSILLSKIWN